MNKFKTLYIKYLFFILFLLINVFVVMNKILFMHAHYIYIVLHIFNIVYFAYAISFYKIKYNKFNALILVIIALFSLFSTLCAFSVLEKKFILYLFYEFQWMVLFASFIMYIVVIPYKKGLKRIAFGMSIAGTHIAYLFVLFIKNHTSINRILENNIVMPLVLAVIFYIITMLFTCGSLFFIKRYLSDHIESYVDKQ